MIRKNRGGGGGGEEEEEKGGNKMKGIRIVKKIERGCKAKGVLRVSAREKEKRKQQPGIK